MHIPSSGKTKRTLSVFSLIMLNVIAIDSLRNLPPNAANGLSIFLYYIVAALIFMIPCALITAELATHHPKTGGVYIWVERAFGRPWGFAAIWLQWIYNVFWYPTILAFLAANIAYWIDPALATQKTFMVSMIIGLFLLATLANAFGMRVTGWLSTVFALVGSIGPMLLIIGLAAAWVIQGKPLAIHPTVSNFLPNLAHQPNLAFLVVVFFSLFGLEMSAVHAEEVKDPKRNFPKALLYSTALIVVTLLLSSTAIALVVPQKELSLVSGIDQALSTFLTQLHLSWLFPWAIGAIVIGSFGNMAAWVLGPAKGLSVADEVGLLHPRLNYRNQKGAPIGILVLQAVVVLALCGLFVGIDSFNTSYWILSDLTAELALVFYILFFAAAIKLRYQDIHTAQKGAYRIPGNTWVMWVVACIGIAGCVFAICMGLIPPTDVTIHSVRAYEALLIGGMILFIVPPFVLYYCKRHTLKNHPSSALSKS